MKMATKIKDTDIKILKACKEALMKSTSRRMLLANMNYIVDLFVFNPPKEIVEHFNKLEEKTKG